MLNKVTNCVINTTTYQKSPTAIKKNESLKAHSNTQKVNDLYINTKDKMYTPDTSSMPKRKEFFKKIDWTEEKENFIREKVLVCKHKNGKPNWIAVAALFNNRFSQNVTNKTIQQRYSRYLDPQLTTTDLTDYEKKFIIDWVSKNGRKWAQLGKIMKRSILVIIKYANQSFCEKTDIERKK